MKSLMAGLTAMLLAGIASAEPVTIVLNPGPGYPTYLSHSCGGVQNNGGATGFDAAGNVVTQHRFFTSCSGSGRGSKNHYYASVWQIVFLQTGQIVSSTPVGTECSWLQGSPSPGCDFTVDVDATYSWNDTATAGTTLVAGGYVAYVQSDSLPPPPPVIDTPAVIGMTERKAKAAILALGLVPYVTYYVTTSYPPKIVFNQSPTAGSAIAAGAQVHVYVAKLPN